MIKVWISPFSDAFLSNKMFSYELPLNRDNALSPYRYLRKYCLKKGIMLDTVDLWKRESSCENVYVAFNNRGFIPTKHAVKRKIKSILTRNELKRTIKSVLTKYAIRRINWRRAKNELERRILFQFEAPVVRPQVYENIDYLVKIYNKLFFSCKVNNQKCHYFNRPQTYNDVLPNYWEKSDRKFLVAINSNKKPRFPHMELYGDRIKAMTFFGKRSEIDLYGYGWEGSVLQKIYRGSVLSKYLALSKYNFAICFENMVMPGYITEKIFDCFFAGTIPVYLGAPDIQDYVSKECFIDMRDFKNYGKLRLFLKSLTKSEIESYRKNARKYLSSEQYKPFTKEKFAEMFVEAIKN